MTIKLGIHDRMRTSKQPYKRVPRLLDDKDLSLDSRYATTFAHVRTISIPTSGPRCG
nr:hypothetical protein HUO10_005397 [Paraburkholderia busanensis]